MGEPLGDGEGDSVADTVPLLDTVTDGEGEGLADCVALTVALTEPEVDGDPDGAFVDLSAENPTSTLTRVVVGVWVLSLLVVIGVGIAHVAMVQHPAVWNEVLQRLQAPAA